MENLSVMESAPNYTRRLLRELVSYTPSSNVTCGLDFGAGQGLFLKHMRDRLPALYAVEIDFEYRQLLWENRFQVVSHLKLLQDNSFDLIWSFNVLEHIEDDEAAIRDLVGKLKTGGRMVIYVPAFQLLFSNMDKQVGHYRRYLREDLVSKFERAGAKIISSEYVDSLGYFSTLLYKAVGGKGVLSKRSVWFYDTFVFPVSTLLDYICSPFFGKNVLIHVTK